MKNLKTFSLKLAIITAFLMLFADLSYAQDSTRRSYHLFNPIPRSLEREEMETDRPNVTETPHTVDAGHIQYETDLLRHQRQNTGESRERRWLYNQGDLKFGLLKNTSLHVMFQTFNSERSIATQSKEVERGSGFGDITLRIKQSLLGNYEGNFSIALMPYLKLPTNRFSDNQRYEWGGMVPMLLQLPNDWKIGMQLEGDYLKDDNEQARHGEFLQSLVISHVLFKKLEIFGETFYTYNFKDHHLSNFIDAALEFEITPDVKIDAGLNYGLQRTAQKEYFLGFAFRY
ncbi:transporter [Mucilaginibacter daejeonensis]|uniref:transporter n=1 Tax=Mucilaginibacter daejeonensis TaxID=398049 RepID=UPI001D178123|nr:transporter [Mucilaginibacter daejeonensis]UEG55198.1 transporter [Mucilaginibacter daejeonensis]